MNEGIDVLLITAVFLFAGAFIARMAKVLWLWAFCLLMAWGFFIGWVIAWALVH